MGNLDKRNKKKWEDVEAEHVELSRLLVGAPRTDHLRNEYGEELGEVFSLLSRHKNLSRITGLETKKLQERIKKNGPSVNLGWR